MCTSALRLERHAARVQRVTARVRADVGRRSFLRAEEVADVREAVQRGKRHVVREPLVLGHEEEVDDDRRAREPGDACV